MVAGQTGKELMGAGPGEARGKGMVNGAPAGAVITFALRGIEHGKISSTREKVAVAGYYPDREEVRFGQLHDQYSLRFGSNKDDMWIDIV